MKPYLPCALDVIAVTLAMATVASACPVCSTEFGQQVRSGIFGPDFGPNLLAILAPLPVLAVVVFGLHRHFSNEALREEPESAVEPDAEELHTYSHEENRG